MAAVSINARLAVLTPEERLARFRQLKEIIARQGGILLDPAQTQELIALGSSLGIAVHWQRIELPNYARNK